MVTKRFCLINNISNVCSITLKILKMLQMFILQITLATICNLSRSVQYIFTDILSVRSLILCKFNNV